MTEQNHKQPKGWFRSFWTGWRCWVVPALALVIVVIVLAVLAWEGTLDSGLGEYTPPTPETQRAKTLWDWMDLLLVPLVLAVGAAFFTWATNRREREAMKRHAAEQREIELDRSHEAALQTYLDRMTELIKEKLHESEQKDEKRSIARARTLTVLRQLDGERKGLLLQFLYESGLIGEPAEEGEQRKEPIVDLRGADLSKANLLRATLVGADLSEANLRGAILHMADLSEATLRGAALRGADLCGADLREADLAEANLVEAILGSANLAGANLGEANLSGAHLPMADLGEANLSGAHLCGASLVQAYLGEATLAGTNLREAALCGANLREAALREADLGGANLIDANLTGAEVTDEQLDQAKILEGATLPDGTVHE